MIEDRKEYKFKLDRRQLNNFFISNIKFIEPLYKERIITSLYMDTEDFYLYHLSNTNDIGKYKSEISQNILNNINDVTTISSFPTTFEEYLKAQAIDHFDLIFDCTDSHQNKIFSSKYCKKKFISFVSISINSSDGIYFSQNYKNQNKTSSCFECLFPQNKYDHRCLNSAMIGPVAGFVTSLACTKIIFALANQDLKLKSEICLIDLLTSDINKLQLADINCPH